MLVVLILSASFPRNISLNERVEGRVVRTFGTMADELYKRALRWKDADRRATTEVRPHRSGKVSLSIKNTDNTSKVHVPMQANACVLEVGGQRRLRRHQDERDYVILITPDLPMRAYTSRLCPLLPPTSCTPKIKIYRAQCHTGTYRRTWVISQCSLFGKCTLRD